MIGLGAAIGLAAAGYGMSQANNVGSMLLGNKLGRDNAALQAALNYKYALKMAENGPSASVAGLRKAGLNPILAATDGAFATPSFNGTSLSFPSSGSGDGNAISAAMAIRQSDANIELSESQSKLNEANAKLAGVRAANEFANRGLNGNAAAISRLLSSFGFDDKAIKGMLPMFESGKSTPNGSVKSEGEVKMSHVASHSVSVPDEFELIRGYENEPVKLKPISEMSSSEKERELKRRRTEEFFRRQRKKFDESNERKRKVTPHRGIISPYL